MTDGSDYNEAADKMLEAISAFLKTMGWNVVVIGSPRIQKPPQDLEFNYEFVVRFTGGKPEAELQRMKAEVTK